MCALEVIGYNELPDDMRPPQLIWHSDERLKEWFAAARQRSKDRAKGIESIDPGEDSDADYVDPEVSKLR